MSWGDSQPHYPGPSIRGPERKPHEGWPSDADLAEQAEAHAEGDRCNVDGDHGGCSDCNDRDVNPENVISAAERAEMDARNWEGLR